MVVNYLLAFKKAYDSIWHEGLFHKLITNQVNGQFLNIIQSMYKNSSSAVKLGNRCTQFKRLTTRMPIKPKCV